MMQYILALVNFGVLLAIFMYYEVEYYSYYMTERVGYKGFMFVGALYFVFMYVFASLYGTVRIGYQKNIELVLSQIMATLMVDIITYFELCLMLTDMMSLEYYWSMLLIHLVWSALWMIFSNYLYKKIFPPRRILLVHGDRPIDSIVEKIGTRKDKFIIGGTVNINAGTDSISNMILDHDAVMLWDIPNSERNTLLKFCYGKSIRVYTMPKISDVIVAGAEELHLFDSPILLTREYAMKIEQQIIKRLIDIVFSFILIIVTSPFMLITAIMVKCCDRGPILYKQTRCTINGKEFKILKFRSMRVDAESNGVARLAKKGDPRITPVGKFIRRVRLDELPQLFNILKGDMSFIGPRPERPEIIAQYMEAMPEFAFRMKVKAGLAGYAQVYGKYNTTPYDKLKLDLCYIENYSIWLDLKLMFLTLRVLFTPDATEGVKEEQVTALLKDASKGIKEDE